MKEMFKMMLEVLSVQYFCKVGDKISEKFSKIKVNSEFGRYFLPCGIPYSYLLRVGLFLLLCLASFMINFKCHKGALNYDYKEIAYIYNKDQNTDQCFEENNKDFVTLTSYEYIHILFFKI